MELQNINNTVIFEANVQSMKELVELAVSQGISLANANLTNADLTNADLTWADLTNADLTNANLTNADLTRANLTRANLTRANLSCVTGLGDNSKEVLAKFKQTRSGIYVYKAIGNTSYLPNPKWVIKPGQYLEEIVNSSRFELCGCGVNFGTLDYIRNNYPYSDYWLCLIEIRDLVNVVIPYNTDGKARCSRLKLVKRIK